MMLADGVESTSDISALADHPGMHGPWRRRDSVAVLAGHAGDPGPDASRKGVQARERAWPARAEIIGPQVPEIIGPQVPRRSQVDTAWTINLDATLIEVHSDERDQATAHLKDRIVFRPLLCFLDNTNETLAGILRVGNASFNTDLVGGFWCARRRQALSRVH